MEPYWKNPSPAFLKLVRDAQESISQAEHEEEARDQQTDWNAVLFVGTLIVGGIYMIALLAMLAMQPA